MRRVVAAMDKARDRIEKNAKRGWPVSRNQQGNPRRKKHSIDFFDVKTILSPTAITATVYNTAEWGYFIRSVMVGETRSQQKDRHKIRDGESLERHAARRSIGKKRHAFTTLMRTPGRKAGRMLARELQDDLVALLRKELS